MSTHKTSNQNLRKRRQTVDDEEVEAALEEEEEEETEDEAEESENEIPPPFEVEKIRGHRTSPLYIIRDEKVMLCSQIEYLVKWKDYEGTFWATLEDLNNNNALQAVVDYNSHTKTEKIDESQEVDVEDLTGTYTLVDKKINVREVIHLLTK
jgi:glutaredoxin